ncbi:MAG: arsenate reductase (glutaredoxin) [Bacteroidales bacterium]|nr:arsenate reductase (glutaredoxin) [Bacteroidales bacterium]
MYKIYHNPRCKKSREGLKYLEDNGLTFEIVKYLEEPLSHDDLVDIVSKLGVNAEFLVRKQEEEYKKHFKGKTFTNDEWIDVLIKHPKLLKRPIVVRNRKAVWAEPADRIAELQ